MSSKGFAEVAQKTGLLDNDPDKSPLWGANKVMLGYCSSDGYMGDAPASEDTWGWHFRGQRLVIAMIKVLLAQHGLSAASRIVLAGGSAGARGMMVFADLLKEQFLPKDAQVVAFLDSPYYLDVLPWPASGFEGFLYQEQQKYLHFNTQAIVSDACRKVHPEEPWKCQFGQYRMPFVRLPFLLVASQYDSYQLSLDTNSEPPYPEAPLQAYVDSFGASTQQHLLQLRDGFEARSARAFLSWTCYNHDVCESDGFHTVHSVHGPTQREALVAFLDALPSDSSSNDDNGGVLSWIDSCSGFQCAGCLAASQR